MHTFKNTVRALIDLKRTPQLKVIALTASRQSDGQQSVVVDVPRISATAASSVQSQVQKLVAAGHVVAELDPTSGTEVTYRHQGNLDHYTEDNLAKRISLQQHPNMIALTQRLWSCALQDGETKLTFADYETYMLCLHRLVLPDFDIAASKELIMVDWKRDCGEKDYLDYSFFHLSMFELVDLWTDTVDPEDYISLLYCITHCLTYLLNERHMLKALKDVSTVDVLEQSKGVTLEDINQDLQRELTSDAFAFHRDQIKLATEANQNAERGTHELDRSKKQPQGSDHSPSRPRSRGSLESGSPRLQSQSGRKNSDGSMHLKEQERRRSSIKSGQKDGAVIRNAESTSQRQRQHSRSGNSDFDDLFSKRKFSGQVNTNEIKSILKTSDFDNVIAASTLPVSSNSSTDVVSVSTPRRQSVTKQLNSPITHSHGDAELSTEMMDHTMVSPSTVDGTSSIVNGTSSIVNGKSSILSAPEPVSVPRRYSQTEVKLSQHRRDEAVPSIPVIDESGLLPSEAHPIRINSLEPSVRPGTQDLHAPGYRLIPDANTSRKPFTVRAAAVTEAAAKMAKSKSYVNSRRNLLTQRTLDQWQQHRTSRFVLQEAAKDTLPNLFIDSSSFTAPLMTIYSSKAPTLTSSVNEIQLKVQEMQGTRSQTPHGSRYGVSVPSSRTSIINTATVFMSPQIQLIKPPSSPRSTMSRRSSSIVHSYRRPSKVSSHQPTIEPYLLSSTVPLTINGRIATNIKFDQAVEANVRVSAGISDGGTEAKSIADLRVLPSPRYVITEPVASHYISNEKQNSTFAPESSRGFVGVRRNSRSRHRSPSRSYSTTMSSS